ncbi:MAG: hypothetical protein PVF63_07835 [Gammaproteobacteria bacterium]|jgi:hypothetical protein
MSAAKEKSKVRRITVNDRMQQGYVYELTESAGENFDARFEPQLTPRQMLAMGVFGGKYLTDCRNEFPADWFEQAKLSPSASDASLNFFGIAASKPLSYWRDKGWIHPDDPRGWFQWYCRYFMGRRHADDDRQIRRWLNMRRHISQLKNNCMRGDLQCRPRQRQALLHWAYDSRKL